MKSNPLVSIIIPNYNHAKYLDQRIQSILKQTYNNFEIIILDDKSTDNSLEIIHKYKSNSKVSLILQNEHNSGCTFKQWQKGLSLAKGDIVWIAESDDDCSSSLLQELVTAYLSTPGIVLAYSTLVYFNDKGDRWVDSKLGQTQTISGVDFIKRYQSMYNAVLNASGAIFSKHAAQKAHLYLNMNGSGDYMFWTEISTHGNVAIVNKQLNYWRRHDGVVTDKKAKEGILQREDKFVVDYIFSQIRISRLRKRLIYAWHNRHVNYDDFPPEIKAELKRLWNTDQYNTLLDIFLVRTYRYLIKKFDYHLGVI